ncbi:MAG: DUF58 domain-containing protein [Bacteroidales bacterium]|nr:DUF58 domain-containing protein [Bacteroidales bacterium]
MNSAELIKKIRKIEIRTRAISQQIFSGQYHSAFKGRGMAFSEVREYTYGDDVRSIDWNVTARFNHPYIKVFEEERELTVMILIDTSSSSLFGTRKMFKRDLITELAAVLSFSAITNNDKVGVIFYNDIVRKFIPPKKGKTHILRIISELVNLQPEPGGTNTTLALQYLINVIRKKCTAFLISDFLETDFETALRIAGKKHDLSAIQICDKGEMLLPSVGLLQIQDLETGQKCTVDTSDVQFQRNYVRWWNQHDTELKEIFRRTGTDNIKLFTDQDYVPALMELFKRRS